MVESNPGSADKPESHERRDVRATLQKWIIPVWLLGVLVTFLIVRVLGSSAGQRVVAALRSHLR
jgi:hypothetical protein